MNATSPLHVIIMAAGKGTRMKSRRPKVLHPLAGKALLRHVLDTMQGLGAGAEATLVITGHEAGEVEAAVGPDARCVRQSPQLGTGHAVQQAVPHLPDDGVTLILNGDVPLTRLETAQALIQACAGQHLALLTISLDDATGYGRIVRDALGGIRAIVEHKDATPEQRHIREVYTGMMAAPTAWLKQAVMALGNDNAQGEFYLTDIVATAVAQGVAVRSAHPAEAVEVLGVNSPLQLAELERLFQRQQALALMEAGVRLADPARIDVRGTLSCGQDVSIDIGCVFEGRVVLGDNVRIDAHCVLADCEIASGTHVSAFCHIDGARVGADALIGPYARLRPGADLAADVRVGNFVEIKNSRLARGAKANHLAYLGDATVGERVNFGAGSITANYDGVNKHPTVIEDDVLVGSNCVLIAPVRLGAGATIGGGSIISKDAPPGQLSIARTRQVSLSHWHRPVKKPKTDAAG
ncbi:bifunctional UDP-N-acetylglucosamine diphosphorylase/glucosamine-1-phosphate N-acetyltransferase GlmU [Amphibiibacter pelophylacis]|uniref:Bifunctional UDP-N-acetylglucosamine diphosphorylase/glucosamine-1-phosphate N-acetyltransferase GlmU n=1 Tax=Amphibiibacter pelophylacis TaxID=1799477 RepID=A0ACC6P2L5_9BURK